MEAGGNVQFDQDHRAQLLLVARCIEKSEREAVASNATIWLQREN